MRGWRRLAIGGGVLVAIVAGTIYPSRTTTHAAGCDTWIGGDGNWGTAANWSTGVVPTAFDDTCITATTATVPAAKADNYTVTLDGSFAVRTLTLGAPTGTQTLAIPANNTQLTINFDSTINSNGVLNMGDAGTGYTILSCQRPTLTNAGHLNAVLGGGGTHYLRVSLTNAAGGSIDLAGPTLQDGMGGGSTRTTNNGAFTIDATGSLQLVGVAIHSTSTIPVGGINNQGTLSLSSATFTERSGTSAGHPIEFDNKQRP